MLQLLTVFVVLALKGLANGIEYNWIYMLYWLTAMFTILSGLIYLIRGIQLINHQE
jgi:cardiolipin synthase